MPIFYTDSGSFNNLEVTGSMILSGSLIVSGNTDFGPTGLTGSLLGTASFATSASTAITASYAQNAGGSGFPFSGTALITGSLVVSGSGITTTGSLNLISGSATFRNTGTPVIINGSVIHGNGEGFPRLRSDLGINGVYFGSAEMGPELTDQYGLGSPTNRWGSLVVNQVTASVVSASTSITSRNYTSSLNNQVGFLGTSSWATTASFAQTASYFSGSVSFPDGITATSFTSSLSNQVGFLGTSSWAVTASFAANAGGGSGFPFSGTALITGSLVVSSSGIQVIGAGVTGSLFSGSLTNILRVSSAVSGAITASGTTSVTLNLDQANFFSVSGSSAGTVTWAVTNPPAANRAMTFIIEYTNGGVKTNNWFTGTRWPAGSAPVLTTGTAPDLLAFTTDDNGTNWRGVLLQRGSA